MRMYLLVMLLVVACGGKPTQDRSGTSGGRATGGTPIAGTSSVFSGGTGGTLAPARGGSSHAGAGGSATGATGGAAAGSGGSGGESEECPCPPPEVIRPDGPASNSCSPLPAKKPAPPHCYRCGADCGLPEFAYGCSHHGPALNSNCYTASVQNTETGGGIFCCAEQKCWPEYSMLDACEPDRPHPVGCNEGVLPPTDCVQWRANQYCCSQAAIAQLAEPAPTP